ncbi:MAG: tetratricopeptide repeat protein [Candidatus Brocadiaceae bacterium]|nr:tetratricopeptide repeat protein [Candidatus Brocadiaceae bacterium]
MVWKMYQKILIVFVCCMTIGIASGKNEKPRIIVDSFKNNDKEGFPVQGVEAVLKSELMRSGYFTVVEKKLEYRISKETVVNPIIKMDNIDLEAREFPPDTIDVYAAIETKTVAAGEEKTDSDYCITGSLSQFGEKYRVDLTVVSIKDNGALNALVGECDSREDIPEMMEVLAQQVVRAVKMVNYPKDVDSILSNYHQGKITYGETADSLTDLASKVSGAFTVHCALFNHYRGNAEMRGKLIEEGERLIDLFDSDNEEHLKCMSIFGIDIFYELANTYSMLGRTDEAIDVYRRAVLITPFNHVNYYRQLGALYKLENNIDESLNAYNKAVNLDPVNFDTRFKLALMYEGCGYLSNAIEQFRSCLRYAQNSSESTKAKEKLNQLEVRIGRQ